MTPSASRSLAFVALLAGVALLLATLLFPATGLCDPLVGPAHVLILVAQVIGVLALRSLRRAGSGRGVMVAAGIAWSAACGAALMALTCAGHWAALGALDVAVGVAGALALTFLISGLAAKSESSGAAGIAVVALLSALAGFGAAWLADARATDRAWMSWARMHEASAVLSEFSSSDGRFPPGEDVELALVLQALPGAATAGLVTDDAWGSPLRYTLDGTSWRITSQGADGKRGPYFEGPSRDFVDDLVLENGMPAAWPEQPCAAGERSSPSGGGPVDLRGRSRP